MSENYELEVKEDAFTVTAVIDDEGTVEVIFSRDGQTKFRTDANSLSVALEFVEKHAEIQFVERTV